MATADLRKDSADLKQVEAMENSAESYAQIMATNKPNPRGPGYIKLYLLAGMVFLCSTMNGFDSSLMGSINALPNYVDYFGLPAQGNASTGIVFAIFQVSCEGTSVSVTQYSFSFVANSSHCSRLDKWPALFSSG